MLILISKIYNTLYWQCSEMNIINICDEFCMIIFIETLNVFHECLGHICVQFLASSYLLVLGRKPFIEPFKTKRTVSIGFCPSQHNSSTSLWSKWKDSASVLLVDILHNRILLFHLIQFESNLLSPPHSWFQSIPPQSASSYSCMLPPSPSAPRSFDSSAYSSPHLQTPSSANSNTGTPTFSVLSLTTC